jgi:hypothetical protein
MTYKYTLKALLFSTKYPTQVIEQYFDNLRVEFHSTIAKRKDLPQNIIAEIEKTFSRVSDESDTDKNKLSWFDAYRIEKYLVHICDEETLDTNLKRLLVSCQDHLPEKSYNSYKSELEDIKKKGGRQEKQSLLLRMQAELHSFFIKRSENREYGFLTRIRIAFIFLVAVALFVSSVICVFCFNDYATTPGMVTITIASGFLGASFSMLVGLKRQLATATMEDLKILHRNSYIFKRAIIGVGAALISYFLIQSGLLDNLINNDLLPDLQISDAQYKYVGDVQYLQYVRYEQNIQDIQDSRYENISVLIIWSLIAGFSEILVPSLLIGVENRISNENP